jgi:2-hydroxychromene-2-carboxylate isomerase
MIDYYLTLISPWTYLGHERFTAMAAAHGAAVTIRPVNFGIVFPATGGLPLPKRAPARQAYRLQELQRWRDHHGIPLNLHPAHFPTDETTAAAMAIAARESGLDAMALAGACLRAVWAEERDIADRDTLLEIAGGLGLDGAALMAEADTGKYQAMREADSHEAIERGVFGAPTYVVGDQVFWGQDRLDFLERALRG